MLERLKRNRFIQFVVVQLVDKITIKSKLIIYFTFSILIPTLIITGILYAGLSEIITQKVNQTIGKNLSNVEFVINQKFDFVNDITNLITINPVLQEVFSSKQPENVNGLVGEILTLDKALDSYYIDNSSSLSKNTLIPTIYMVDRPAYKKYNVSSKVYDISVIENENWYKEMSNRNTVVGESKIKLAYYPDKRAIRIARKIYSVKASDSFNYAALLTLDIECEYFEDILKSYITTANSSIIILDANGTSILSSNAEQGGEKRQEFEIDYSENDSELHIEKIDGIEMLIKIKKIDALGWTVFSMTPLNEINAEQRDLNRKIIVVMVIFMTCSFILALLLSNNISSPILSLVKSMSTVQDGNWNIEIEYSKKDEFGYLIEKYKTMITEIKNLIEKLYTSEVNKNKAEYKAKDAELKMLQAQINPHFLYNTLDSIHLYAIKYKVPDISDMILSLSNFYRIGLSKGQMIITIEEEITHVESYLQIQKMRFKDQLNFRIQIPNELRRNLMVKLTLQPITENAIVHGIQKSKRKGLIDIVAFQSGDFIMLEVTNNGDADNVDEINEILQHDREKIMSFGIRNVNERIKSVFGNDYGLKYRKNEDGGITASIKIPSLRTMEGYNVNNDLSR